MCGLVALLAPDIDRDALARLNDLMVHRGPDDAGIYVGDGVGLAARRLSILDLEGGHQPLSNEDGTIWIAYNGEIMNSPALRAELAGLGHRFATASDTEVVVHAYEEWGDQAVTRLRGMFAFALWDGRRRRLVAARDRFGIKPLYYAHDGALFACASEMAPVLAALPALPRRVDRAGLWRLFELGHVPGPGTLLERVVQLPPAHLLVVEDGRLETRPYWQLAFPPEGEEATPPLADAVEAFRDRLRETVDAWRLSDVPVGSLLSGGIDSSALAALLTDVSGGSIHTFTIGFARSAGGRTYDESAVARRVAEHLGSTHHEIVFGPEAFDLLPRLVERLETPLCSATAIPIYMLYRACREAGFKVVLTGEGADELLGGYHWMDGDRRIRPWLRWPRLLRGPLTWLPLPASRAGRRVLGEGGTDPVARYALWQRLTSPPGRHMLLAVDAEQPPIAGEWAARLGPALAGRHPLHQFLQLEAATRLPDFINLEVDRMSMASSVEARPPFLDHELWEHAARLAPSLKLAPKENKRLLRQAMAGALPAAVTRRPKRGLATPHAIWWRLAPLPAWAEEAISPAALHETGLFQPDLVGRLRLVHEAGDADHSRVLTGVLTTQLWWAGVR